MWIRQNEQENFRGGFCEHMLNGGGKIEENWFSFHAKTQSVKNCAEIARKIDIERLHLGGDSFAINKNAKINI